MTRMAAASLSFSSDDCKELDLPENTLLLCHHSVFNQYRGNPSHSIQIKLREVHLRPQDNTPYLIRETNFARAPTSATWNMLNPAIRLQCRLYSVVYEQSALLYFFEARLKCIVHALQSLWTHPEQSQKTGRRTDVCMKSCSHTFSGPLQNHDMEILPCPLLFSIAGYARFSHLL